MLRSGHERSILISKCSSVPCSRRQLEPVVGIHLNTDASLCINYCTEMHYTRQNFGLQYWSLFLMECHHDVIPVPNPARPPFRVFLKYQKQPKKLPKLGKYDHKDDNVEEGEYDTSHGLIMASAHNTTFYYNSLHCTASASATLVKFTSSNIGRCVMIAEFLNVNFYTNLKLPTQCLHSKVNFPFILPNL